MGLRLENLATTDKDLEEQRRKQASLLKALGSSTPPTSPGSVAGSSQQLRMALGAANRAAGAGTATGAQAQQAVQALQETQGKQAMEAEASKQGRTQQLATLGLQQQAINQQQQLFEREQLLGRSIQEQQTRFAALSRDLTKQLHDDTVQFKHDDMGRTLWNDKQLMDYAVIQAQNEEDLQNYTATKQILLDRKTQVLKKAYAMISQQLAQVLERDMTAMQNTWTAEQQAEEQKLKLILGEAKKRLQNKLSDMQRKSQEEAAMGGLVSAGIGALTMAVPAAGIAVGVLEAASGGAIRKTLSDIFG